jgi:hypothetical protein
MTRDIIRIELTRDEALVIFEWLWRVDQAGADLHFADRAEQLALWALQGRIEKLLGEIPGPDSEEQLSIARERVRDEHSG